MAGRAASGRRSDTAPALRGGARFRSRPWAWLLALAGCSAAGAPVARAPLAANVPAAQAPTMNAPTVAAPPPPPATDKIPVVDEYHGVAVQDDYRWLEDGAAENVHAWTAAQNAYSRKLLDALPGRPAIAARVKAVLSTPVTIYGNVEPAGGRWFVQVMQPPKQQPFVLVMDAGGDPEHGKVLVDPNALDPTGKTAIDWFVPSFDGRKLAVSLSKAGTESGDVTVFDVDSGASEDVVPRVNGGTAGGDVAFTPDGRGFYYTRYPAPGERPDADLPFFQQLYFHRLGSDASADRYELGRDLPRIAEVRVDVDRRTGRVLASVQNGDGGQFQHYLRRKQGGWRQLTTYGDGVVQLAFGSDTNDLFAISRKDAPRGVVLRIDGKKLDLGKARVLHAPERDVIVSEFWGHPGSYFGKNRWYATFQLGGPSEVRAFDYDGKPLSLPAPFEIGSATGLIGDRDGAVLWSAGSFLRPNTWFRADDRSATPEPTSLRSTGPLDLSTHRVVREIAISRDGTQVPFSVLLPEGANLDGHGACVVTGYGGYGLSLTPSYSARTGLWLERGVTYAIANLRGGGELGQAWHEAGRLERKQNVFDDFAAVLAHLHDRRYCRPERTGIVGGSNGGLLMGATLVQHPELVHAVVSYVGFYDSLRSELSPNGAFNIPEFGTVADRAQFEALYAYSPYHHVVDGRAYPRVLFITGDNDPRVDPMHSRKMTARLQAANRGGGPILLRTSASTGHGGGSDLAEVIAQQSDAFTFMLDSLGVKVE
jgi:prolyl oligopeptidase